MFIYFKCMKVGFEAYISPTTSICAIEKYNALLNAQQSMDQ